MPSLGCLFLPLLEFLEEGLSPLLEEGLSSWPDLDGGLSLPLLLEGGLSKLLDCCWTRPPGAAASMTRLVLTGSEFLDTTGPLSMISCSVTSTPPSRLLSLPFLSTLVSLLLLAVFELLLLLLPPPKATLLRNLLLPSFDAAFFDLIRLSIALEEDLHRNNLPFSRLIIFSSYFFYR